MIGIAQESTASHRFGQHRPRVDKQKVKGEVLLVEIAQESTAYHKSNQHRPRVQKRKVIFPRVSTASQGLCCFFNIFKEVQTSTLYMYSVRILQKSLE